MQNNWSAVPLACQIRCLVSLWKCKDARSDASIRVSVGLEPPPPEPAGGRTHCHFYTGDPPSSSARAWERRCPPARTVQARATARRPHRPGPGSDLVLPPGRCKPQVTRTRSALRLDGNPPPSPARAGERHCPPARAVQAAGDSDRGPTPSDPPPSSARAWGRQCHPARTVPRSAGDSGFRARAAGGGPPPSPARAGERLCPPARTVQVTGDSDCGPTSPDPPPSLVRARDRQCHPARTVPRNAGGPTPGDSDRADGAAARPPAHAGTNGLGPRRDLATLQSTGHSPILAGGG